MTAPALHGVVTRAPEGLLKVLSCRFAVSNLAAQVVSLGGLFEVLGSAGWVLGGLLVVIVCLGVGSAIGSTWIRHRTHDIGSLKAIGWSRGKIDAALTAEVGLVGLAVAIVGVVVGSVLSLGATAVIA